MLAQGAPHIVWVAQWITVWRYRKMKVTNVHRFGDELWMKWYTSSDNTYWAIKLCTLHHDMIWILLRSSIVLHMFFTCRVKSMISWFLAPLGYDSAWNIWGPTQVVTPWLLQQPPLVWCALRGRNCHRPKLKFRGKNRMTEFMICDFWLTTNSTAESTHNSIFGLQ